MKIRNGFVSNSSSSSFVILKESLTEDQLEQINNHTKYARENFHQFEYTDDRESWDVYDKGKTVRLYTSMDNFDMFLFLTLIGIDEEDIISEN